MDTATSYMGLKLKNPLIVSSSPLTATIESLLSCDAAGAGAVVLKSIFEEEISGVSDTMSEALQHIHSDGYDFVTNVEQQVYLDRHLSLIEEAKKKLSIPVIASINCLDSASWDKYAEKVEAAGADAIELNLYILPADMALSSDQYEERYIQTVKRLTERLSLPVSVKLAVNFTAAPRFLARLCGCGAKAVVLFNRFFALDVNLEKQTMMRGVSYSSGSEAARSLRWISLCSGRIKMDFCANSGIHDAAAVLKQLLVGAKAVQLYTVLEQKGVDYLKQINAEMAVWMEQHGYQSLEQFCGKLAQKEHPNEEIYERLQYIKRTVI